MADEQVLRLRMVNNQLRTFDVTDHRVQDAVLDVARERYVPDELRFIAYSDEALPLVRDTVGRPLRTMTRPAVLGRLLQLAQVGPDDVVLLVGAGLGYSAAVLGQLASSVIALEVDPDLAAAATSRLERDDVANVVVVTGPLAEGYPSEAPFDVVFVDGAVEEEPEALIAQLRPGGRLTAIEGRSLVGRAVLYERDDSGVSKRYDFNAAADVLPGFEKRTEFEF